MTTSVNPFENLAVIRLLEFLSDHSPWNRSLWGVGTVLALDELSEACTIKAQGHLSELAVKRVVTSLNRRIGQHPCFTVAEKKLLCQHLQQVHRPDSVAHYIIRQISSQVASDYMTRWGRAIRNGTFNVEFFARNVAGHLLDAGFSGQYMRNFINERLQGNSPFSLSALCDELQQEMVASPPREFEVLLGLERPPRLVNGIPSSWLRGPQVANWLTSHGFDTTGIRAHVAIILKVAARDMAGAAQVARSESDRYAARTLLATGFTLSRLPKLWVAGSDAPVDINHDRRGVAVEELFRENRVFSSDLNKSVDAALELLAHLDGSSPAAAVAGGWGAIEGLLAPSDDRSAAADNLASLVACSFPRAELTKLAHQVRHQFPGQYADLDSATTNRERARVIGSMIIAETMPTLQGLSDQAAATRMKKLFRNPKGELEIIREVIADSFHRLYRQRNLILHGGKLDSVALTPGLRTVAKLAGAGMDRITHGHYVQNLKPLELVAKANIALALVDAANPLACVDLLEMA
jgi:hypothetical protein